MPWDAIKYVGLGLTLAAFVVAAIAWLLKSKSEEKERLIDLAKDDERAGLVRDALEFFSVDTAGLTKAQQYQLALEQIRARAQRFKIIAIVVCIIAALGAGIAAYAIVHSIPSTKGAPVMATPAHDEQKSLTLLASIWKVELDTKGALVATKEFPNMSGGGLKEFADWVASQLGLTALKDAPGIHLKVQIPADLKNQKPVIQRIPDGPMEVLLWDERGNAKGRSKLTWEALKDMQTPFQLEIRIPGREATVIEATPGMALAKEMELAPATVSIGVERFAGLDDGMSAEVCSQLGSNALIKVVSPDILEAVRKEIEARRETMRAHPMVQMGIRAMGVDYIISGSVQAKTP